LIPGVGKKTAERLIVDLREKMTALSAAQIAEETGAPPEAAAASSEDSVRSQALSGLMNLGYQRSAAEKAIDAALSEGGDISVETVLKRSLRKLGSRLIG
jgi:Holliday junction DNA helicase RuvA